MMTTADTRSPIRAHQEYVFLLQVRSNPDKAWFALYPCGVLSYSTSNLAMLREAGTDGADQSFSDCCNQAGLFLFALQCSHYRYTMGECHKNLCTLKTSAESQKA